MLKVSKIANELENYNKPKNCNKTENVLSSNF